MYRIDKLLQYVFCIFFLAFLFYLMNEKNFNITENKWCHTDNFSLEWTHRIRLKKY